MKLRQQPQKIPGRITLTAPAEIAAAAEGKPREFRMRAYNGDVMRVAGWGPVVVDLAGLRGTGQTIPILKDHDARAVVGHGQARRTEDRQMALDVAGVVSGSGPEAQEVLANHDNGFPWQASVGVDPDPSRFVELPAGKTAAVNGRQVVGPVLIARRSTLREVSVVALGADRDTTVSIAAAAAGPSYGAMTMEFEKWMEALGLDLSALSEDALGKLRAKYDAEMEAAREPAPSSSGEGEGDAAEDGTAEAIRASREAEARDLERREKVRTICAKYREDCGETKVAEVQARAIREGLDPRDVELELLRASRPKPCAPGGGRRLEATALALECAIRMGSGEPEAVLLRRYGEQTMEAAYPHRRLGLKGVIQACCHMDGAASPHLGASEKEWIQAGFSTAGLSTLLSNTANKSMMDAYTAVESVAKKIARKLTAGDFKTHTGVQLTGDFVMKEVGAAGEIKHASVGEDSYTYAVKTFARMFGLTRQMLKNDDLGAFMEVPRMIGRGAALALEDAFWTLVLANTGTFFGAAHKNYITDADVNPSRLSSASLAKAVEKFRKQTDPDGHPIKLTPKFLVVPPEEEPTADELYVSRNIQSGNTGKVPDANVHAGKYQPLVSPYLSNTSYTGNSSVAWYLFGDPADIPAFGIAYLDGIETPTVEEVALSGEYLGQAWRGYFDFGVCQINHRGAVKSKGAA